MKWLSGGRFARRVFAGVAITAGLALTPARADGTNDIARLGGPASHGCVRLHPSHAAALFALVERNGPRNTRIEISK